MHCPLQGAFVGQTWVGVQILLVGQGLSLPTVHGTTGGKVWVVKQSPLQWYKISIAVQGMGNNRHDL